MVTLTFTGSPSEIHSDMRDMLNLTAGKGATAPVISPELKARAEQAPHVSAFDPQPIGKTEMGNGAKPATAPAAANGPQITNTGAGSNGLTAQPTASPSEPTPKRRRRTKAEIEAAKSNGHAPVGPGQDDENETVESESPAVVQMQEAKPTTSVAPPIINKETVAQALQQVNVVVGLPKAREILQSFGANRQSEIKEDQYRAFIEKCNEAVMLEG